VAVIVDAGDGVGVRVAAPVGVTVEVEVAVEVGSGVPVSVSVGVWVGVSVGVLEGGGVSNERTPGQKPPATTMLPAVSVPASGWPAVPPTRMLPLALNVAPPPSMVLRLTS
jgi:hypothetical protein